MQYEILLLNGPNLGAVGVREPALYGSQTMDVVAPQVKNLIPDDIIINLCIYQNNSEGALIDRLEKAHYENIDGIVFNAGAYTHTSLALADCLAWITPPCVEVHISNVFARAETVRHQSFIAGVCVGSISGFGLYSYALGVAALVEHIRTRKQQ